MSNSRDLAARSVSAGRLVLVAVLVLAAWPAGAEAQREAAGERGVDVLMLERGSSPVLSALRDRLGARLDLDYATPKRLRRTHRYELLIVDADTSTARELRRRERALRRFLDAGAAVLLLDADRGDERVLRGLTGFSAAPADRARGSRVVLIRLELVDGTPGIERTTAPRLIPRGANRLSPRARRAVVRRETRRLARLVAREAVARRHPAQAAVVSAAQAANSELPPEVQHLPFSETLTGSGVTPPAYFDPAGKDYGERVTSFPGMNNRREVPWTPQLYRSTMTHTFNVYLDNGTNAGGDFQVVTYDVSGTFTPATDYRFNFMWGEFPGGIPLEKAWWTGIAGLSVTPGRTTDSRLTALSALPETTGRASPMYTGSAFQLGYTQLQATGSPTSASYFVDHRIQRWLPWEWALEKRPAGNAFAWEHSARVHCDVRTDHYREEECFDKRFLAAGTPITPNDGSIRAYDLGAGATWRSTSLLKDSTAGGLSFDVRTPITLADTYCVTRSFLAAFCTSQDLTKYTIGTEQRTYSFDASRVVPVGIKSVTLDPTDPDAANQEHVTGTITLPAKVRMDTTVVVRSDDPHAELERSLGNGRTTTTVVVPEGSSSGTFDIATNDDRIRPGNSVTARITSFYGTTVTTELRIRRKS
jgi:hypothetical protein